MWLNSKMKTHDLSVVILDGKQLSSWVFQRSIHIHLFSVSENGLRSITAAAAAEIHKAQSGGSRWKLQMQMNFFFFINLFYYLPGTTYH